jgi:DNA-binding NtrC family response regulator
MSEKPNVLLVEDDADWLEIYRDNLQGEDYLVDIARSIRQAFDLLQKTTYDVVVTDLKMLGFGDDFGGFSVLQKTKEISPDTQVMVITAYGTRDIAMRAMQQGAFDYVVKPPDAERFRLSIRGAIQAKRVIAGKRSTIAKSETVREPSYQTPLSDSSSPRPAKVLGIIGNSEGMRLVFEEMGKAVNSSFPVLIWGEAGTGKQLIARTIHTNGQRRSRPFSYKACEELSTTNYWNAINRNLSRLRGGTLFLDNLARLRRDDQTTLETMMPALAMNEIRLIASINGKGKNLEQVGYELGIQPTLLTAIAQQTINIPPLRYRKDGDDIPALIGHFVHTLTDNMSPKPQIVISSAAMRHLLEYDYGIANVRELYEIIQSAINLLGGDGTILPEHLLLPDDISPSNLPHTILDAKATESSGVESKALPLDIYTQCRDVLLRCNEFDSHASLEAVFIVGELTLYRDSLPETANKGERVNQMLAYLMQKRLRDGRLALMLFLSALQSRRNTGDQLYDELQALGAAIHQWHQSPDKT